MIDAVGRAAIFCGEMLLLQPLGRNKVNGSGSRLAEIDSSCEIFPFCDSGAMIGCLFEELASTL